jgi:hypothetical protein
MMSVTDTYEATAAAPACEDDRSLYLRVRGEFREMPELALTLEQVARLFTIDRDVCQRVLASLVRDGVLRTRGSTFICTTGRPRCQCP